MKTFTTLGATFFTTGAKLVVSLVSRLIGELSTITLGGSVVPDGLPALPSASWVKATTMAVRPTAPATNVSRIRLKNLLLLSIIYNCPFTVGVSNYRGNWQKRLTGPLPADYKFVRN